MGLYNSTLILTQEEFKFWSFVSGSLVYIATNTPACIAAFID